MKYQYYKIADICFRIGNEELINAVASMPGFNVFVTTEDKEHRFEVIYGDVPEEPVEISRQYDFMSDGVASRFSSVPGGYHLMMKHDDGSELILWTSQEERKVYIKGSLAPQMVRFALWIAYGTMCVGENRIPIHGSCIVNAGRAYIFLGESGTGKSTHTRLWRENIEGSHLLNDDSPIISAEPDGVFIYGSPWSGKTPCYHQKKFPLSACVRLSQAPFNHIEKLSVLKAYAALHPSCPPEFAYDNVLYSGISSTLDKVLSEVNIYHLQCLPDADAARLSFNTISGNGSKTV